jgi:CCR4-NOT transcriptional regulation complex NOT5 subunit
MDAAEAISVTDTSSVPVVVETEQAGFAISTSSEAGPLRSTATSTSEELALDEFEQAEASDLSDANVADHSVSNDEAQDIHVDTVSIPNSTATVVVSEDAPLALSLEEEPSMPADNAQAPDLELDPLGERLTQLDQANSDVHEVQHQLDDEHIEGGSSALSNHDEL